MMTYMVRKTENLHAGVKSELMINLVIEVEMYYLTIIRNVPVTFVPEESPV